MQLDHLRALITGGTQNFGFELACWLAKQGARVAVCGHREDALAKAGEDFAARGVEVVVLPGDVTRPAEMENLAKELRERFGRLDLLVNNASLFSLKPLAEMEPAEAQRMVEVGLVGAVNATRAHLPLLCESGGAVVLNMIGWSGLPGKARRALYSAVKAGLRTFGEGLNRELNRAGVRVTNLVLGSMASWLGYHPSDEELGGKPMLRVSEVIGAVEFILSRPTHLVVEEVRLRHLGEEL